MGNTEIQGVPQCCFVDSVSLFFKKLKLRHYQSGRLVMPFKNFLIPISPHTRLFN